jgi:hypothetical protein
MELCYCFCYLYGSSLLTSIIKRKIDYLKFIMSVMRNIYFNAFMFLCLNFGWKFLMYLTCIHFVKHQTDI